MVIYFNDFWRAEGCYSYFQESKEGSILKVKRYSKTCLKWTPAGPTLLFTLDYKTLTKNRTLLRKKFFPVLIGVYSRACPFQTCFTIYLLIRCTFCGMIIMKYTNKLRFTCCFNMSLTSGSGGCSSGTSGGLH